METASPEAMKRLAEVGVGLALVPERLVGDEEARGRLCQLRLRDASFTRRLATAVHRQRDLPAAARGFLAALYRRYPPLPPVVPARKAARPTVAGGPRQARARRKPVR
jgi:DNA-binding transcriptional LysR family regulator